MKRVIIASSYEDVVRAGKGVVTVKIGDTTGQWDLWYDSELQQRQGYLDLAKYENLYGAFQESFSDDVEDNLYYAYVTAKVNGKKYRKQVYSGRSRAEAMSTIEDIIQDVIKTRYFDGYPDGPVI